MRNSSNFDKLDDRVARPNPKVYEGNYNLVKLEDWIKEMKKNICSCRGTTREKGEHWDLLLCQRS